MQATASTEWRSSKPPTHPYSHLAQNPGKVNEFRLNDRDFVYLIQLASAFAVVGRRLAQNLTQRVWPKLQANWALSRRLPRQATVMVGSSSWRSTVSRRVGL